MLDVFGGKLTYLSGTICIARHKTQLCMCVCREANDCINDAEPASQTPPAGAVDDTSGAEPSSQTPSACAFNDTSDAEPASQTPPAGAGEDK